MNFVSDPRLSLFRCPPKMERQLIGHALLIIMSWPWIEIIKYINCLFRGLFRINHNWVILISSVELVCLLNIISCWWWPTLLRHSRKYLIAKPVSIVRNKQTIRILLYFILFLLHWTIVTRIVWLWIRLMLNTLSFLRI